MRDLGREGERERPAARAEVDADRLGLGARTKRVDGELGDTLGLGARHEDSGSDRELERPERRPAGEVLQRFAPGAALDETGELRGIRFLELATDDHARLHAAARQPEHVPDEQFGIDFGVGHSGRCEPRRRLVANRAQRPRAGGRARRIHAMECNPLARAPADP